MFTEHTVLNRPHCGESVRKHRGLYRLEQPIQRGKIMDWDSMIHIWEHAINKVDRKTKDTLKKISPIHPVMFIEPPLSSVKTRVKVAERFFEYFRSPGLYYANSSVLSLFACGKTTSLVVDVGHGKTTCVPVSEGCALPHSITHADLAGQDVTDYLNNLLHTEHGIRFHTSAEIDIIREM
eukprot:UN31366